MTKATLETKIISLLITLTMLIGMIPMSGIVSFATGETVACEHVDEDYDALCDICEDFLSEPEGEITLGETITKILPEYSTDWLYLSFTPETTGRYLIKAISSSDDPMVCLFDSNKKLIDEDDDSGREYLFYLEENLTAGKTYYIALADYDEDIDCTFVVNAMCNEHTPQGDAFCQGTLCSVCGAYYGESKDAHIVNSSGNCEYCSTFAPEISATATLGEKMTIELPTQYENEFVKFVPAASGEYYIKSFANDYSNTPYLSVYNKNGNTIGSDNCGAEGSQFYLDIYLTAGEAYYFKIYEIIDNAVCTFIVNARCDEHTASETVNCIGTVCSVCGAYYGEGNGAHDINDSGYCSECKLFAPEVSATATLGEKMTLELTTQYKYKFVKFVLATGGNYYIKSFKNDNSSDPYVCVFNAEGSAIGSDDDGDEGSQFYLDIYLAAGGTYYLGIQEEMDNKTCIFVINAKCDEHTASETVNCIGTVCATCGAYYGDAGAHTPEGAADCRGTFCSVCEEYYGETSNAHDDEDVDGFCDVCYEFIAKASATATLGEKTSLELPTSYQYKYVKFIPEKSGNYYIRSFENIYSDDPYLYVYDDDGDEIGGDDDYIDLQFYLEVSLKAGKTYYLGIYERMDNAVCTFIINYICDEHMASDTVNCLGTLCSVCDIYFGEGNGEHTDGDKDCWCDICDIIVTDLVITEGKSTVALKADKNVVYKFIPTVSGTYLFTSDSIHDPYIAIYNEKSDFLNSSNAHVGFYVEVDLKAGEEYFVELYENNYGSDCPIYIRTACKEHTSGEKQTCEGYECTVCGAYFGDAGDHSFDYTYNEGYHWIECTVCGTDQTNNQYGYHIYGENGYCVCGYLNHTHSFGELQDGGSYHYGYCLDCNLLKWEYHSFSDDTACSCGREWFDEGIYFGATLLRDGEYLDNNGKVSTSQPEGGYAYLKDGVLTLNNFELENSDENPIYGSSALYSELDLTIKLVGKNKLYATHYDAIYTVYADIVIEGEGSLDLCGSGEYDGIDVDAGNLTINSGTLTVKGTDNGIEVEDGDLLIKDGDISVIGNYDGIYVYNGNATISGGAITVDAYDDGIYVGGGDLTISGGAITITTEEDDGIDIEEGKLTISDATITVNSGDHGFDVYGKVEISNSDILIWAGDEGMEIDELLIKSGNIYINADDYGIECDGDVTIDSGYVYIYADDYEGIKASYDFVMNGGTLVIKTEDDHGITAYEYIYLNGGQLEITLEDSNYYAMVAEYDIIFSENMSKYETVSIVHDDTDCVAVALSGEALTEIKVNIDGESKNDVLGEMILEINYDKDGKLVVSATDPESGEKKLLTKDVDYTEINVSDQISDKVWIAGIGDYVGLVSSVPNTVIDVTPGSVTSVTAPIAGSDGRLYLKFTPTVSAYYIIYSESDYDPYVAAYDSDYNWITESDDVNGSDFYLVIYLEAGETYYFDVADNDGTNECKVYLTSDCDEHVGGEATYTEKAVCDVCGQHYGDVLVCDHMCHKDGVYAIIWNIFEEIYDYFGIKTECECGEEH